MQPVQKPEQRPLQLGTDRASSKQRFNVDGLKAGEFYWFAVSANGTAGESSLSEPARVMAAA